MLLSIFLCMIATPIVAVLGVLTKYVVINYRTTSNKNSIAGATVIIALSVADTLTFATQIRNAIWKEILFICARMWVDYCSDPMAITTQFRVDARFNFQQSYGWYIVSNAKISGNGISEDITPLWVFYATTNTLSTVSFAEFLTECSQRGLIRSQPACCRQYLEIKYLTNTGIYEVKFDIETSTNITTGEDLIFGDIVIDPPSSKNIVQFTEHSMGYD